MLTCGIFLLSPKFEQVEADVAGTDGAQFILTGYSGNSPKSFFTTSGDTSTLVNAQEKEPDKDYINKNGQKVDTFYFITGKHSSLSKAKSSGVCEIYPSAEMQKIIGAGQMMVKGSAGLLALNDEKRSKVNITIQIIAGGEVAKTLTLTSDKVSSNSSVYEPDWVETEAIVLPTNTEKIVYSFESREATNRTYAAKFCIFEPTVFFATNLSECTMSTTSQSVKQGQVLKLSASNIITRDSSTSQYFEYYKNIHKITYEITKGSEYANVVGNYLYVSENAPFGTQIEVRAKCRKSTLNGEYIYSDAITFCCDIQKIAIHVDKDFSNPATITGEGNYFVGDYATVSISTNSGFEFVGWEIDGQIVSSENSYTFKVETNSKIKAKFTKTIKIKQIVVAPKVYDGTTACLVESVVLEGVENNHDVQATGFVANFATSGAKENKNVIISNFPTLVGEHSGIYCLENFVPTVTSNINKKPLEIRANSLSKTYGESDPVLTFEESGLVEGEQALGTLSRDQGENAGEYMIGLGTLENQNPNYQINFISSKFVINQREIVLSDVSVISKTYDKTTSAQILATTKNIVAGDDVSVKFCASFVDANAGLNKIVNIEKIDVVGKEAGNYFVTNSSPVVAGVISQKAAEVVVQEQEFCYGDKIDIKYDTQGLLGDDRLDGKLEISSSDVGEHVVSLGTLKNPNYSLSLTAQNIHIVPKKIDVFARANSKVYGESDQVLGYDVTGLIEGDELGGAVEREAGEEIGTYSILIGTLGNDNYKINFHPAIFEITKREIQIKFNLKNKTYDGTKQIEFLYDVKNALQKDDVQLEVDLSFEDASVAMDKKVVINKLALVGENKNRYQLNFDENTLFASIFAKKVEIFARSTQKTYGDDDPELVLQYVGLIDGEVAVGELVRIEGEDVGKYLYEIPQLMIDQNSNYEISLGQEISLVVVAKSIDVKTLSKQKQFGENDPEIEYSWNQNDFVFGQTFEDLIGGSAKREVGEEIGRYNYVVGSLTLGKNYSINFIPDGLLTITKRDIEVIATDVEKIYGENDPTLSITQLNIVAGVSSTIKLKREKGENVGTYSITYESLDDPHYNITFTSGTLTITPCDIVVKAQDAFKHYSEDDPQIDFVLTLGSLQFDDELSSILTGVVSREVGEDVGVYEIGQGTLNAIDNYNMTFVCGDLYIYAQELVIKILDQTKYYGDKDPTFSFEIVSGNAENDVFSGKARRIYGESCGEYTIDVGTLSTPKNYKFKYTCGKLSILPRPIEITSVSVEKIYGEGDPEFSYVVTEGSLVGENDLVGEIYRENVGVKIYESVGSYPLLSTLSNPNYSITYVAGHLAIKQREIVISSTNCSSIYGEEIKTDFDYVLTGQIVAGDTLTGGLYKAEGVDVGVYPIRCSINLGRNYRVKYNQAYYEILPRKLTVTVGANEKIYSNPDPAYSVKIISGELVEGQTLEWEVQREACEDVGEYVLSVVSLDENYELDTQNSILQILKKDVKLSLELLDKPYDGNAICKIKNPIVSGLVDNEIILAYDKNTCATFASVLPANDIEVELKGFGLEGAKSLNYNLVLPTQNFASITHSSLESQDVVISTYSSTSMKYGTRLNIQNIDIGSEYNGKKVLRSLSVGLVDEGGKTLSVDRALNMSILINDLNNFNNIHVYGKNSSGEYVELNCKIVGENLCVETSTFSDFIVVCDNEIWIDIAVAVCVGIILGVVLCLLVLDMKKKKGKQK